MSDNNEIKVAIVSQSTLLRHSLQGILKRGSGLTVVASATASNCDTLFAVSPDVALVQHDQSNCGPIRELGAAIPGMKVILIEAVAAELDVVGCLKCGVAGFTLKDAFVEDVVNAIHTVAAGGRVMPQCVTDRLCSQLSEIGKRNNGELSMGMAELTLRERQVAEFVLDGLSNKEIAAQMNISTYTVKSHVHNILDKLSISSRIDLVNYFCRRERYVSTWTSTGIAAAQLAS